MTIKETVEWTVRAAEIPEEFEATAHVGENGIRSKTIRVGDLTDDQICEMASDFQCALQEKRNVRRNGYDTKL